MISHVFFCVSNACVESYGDNSLTKFTNNLPKDLNLRKRYHWEIGVAAFGVDLKFSQTTNFANIIQIKSTVTDYTDIGELPVLYHTNIKNNHADSYFFKSIKNIKYFPLKTSSIQNITTSFTDIKDEQLKLKPGQPSIVQFHLRKIAPNMGFTQTHIQVDSDMDFDNEHSITVQDINDFKVYLKNPIHLNHGAKIGLTGISFPNSIGNIPSFIEEQKIDVTCSYYSQSLNYQYDKDHTADDIVKILNDQLDSTAKRFIRFEIIADADPNENKVLFFMRYIHNWKTTENFKAPLIGLYVPAAYQKIFGCERSLIYASYGKNGYGTTFMKFPTRSIEADEKLLLTIGAFDTSLLLKKGRYKNGQELIEKMSETMDDQLKDMINFSIKDGKFKVRLKDNVDKGITIQISIPYAIKEILGVEQHSNLITVHNRLPTEAPEYLSPYKINVDALFPAIMMCYTNCIIHSAVGDELYPIFKVIPIKRNDTDKYTTIHFENVEFYKCNTTRLDMLHFQLKRLDGHIINFETHEKLLINLCIKNPIN